ncbi:MAG: ThuA domain-containing protein, partial [Sphingobacteriaceae bacterium]
MNIRIVKFVKVTLLIVCIVLITGVINADGAAKNISLRKIKVLVYTKNGQGFVHDNIASAVACIQKLGQEQGFKVDVSDKPEVFTEDNLKQYTMLIFPSTNNDVFATDTQRLAFRRYIEAGGGFVGIHSVTGTERRWTWFKQMLGCTFA